MKGFYAVFEGVDGSGKTTLMEAVAAKIAALDGIIYRIPGSVVPELSKLWKKEMARAEPNQRYLALLFAADRMRQAEIITEKQYNSDIVILADRSFLSSYVYQGISSGISSSWLEIVNKFCVEPDKIIYCDVSIPEALRRIAIRQDGECSFEREEFLKEAKKQYEAILKGYGGKVFTVDMEQPPEENAERVLQFLLR